ncbi:AraC family transcriptional regulator [Actinacidiphila epipremni]|uniref:Helix-turn-helix transcriptional regulator n=1 Tax=Actinacidiphila epipremni TaxID=2053013 RepID=A0ABX0ZS21_9ACTN|nr:helix-turn-helix transcriptional regulator [Actinacidiphila epipremni]NJP44333.1 helix-turn-helix transcriptional regulator [Actinacidiphila epipremni]
MSPNSQPAAAPPPPAEALRVLSFDMARGERFGEHEHDVHQLVWTPAGVLTVDVGDHSWVLPPSLALWIPAGVPHATGATRPSQMRSVYVAPDRCPVRWAQPTVVAVGPLLRELVIHLADPDLAPDPKSRAEAVLFDLLRPVGVMTIELPMPADVRALRVAQALLARPADPRPLEAWGREVGASARTLARLFAAETGMSFGRWRTRARLRAGLEHMAANRPLAAVAHHVGYTTPSSFIAAFRQETGRTPGAYFAVPQQRRP